MGNSKIAIVLLALSTSAFGAQTFTVDDDGQECAGALATIQAAVDQAQAGDTVVVCRGTYLGAVRISGHERDGLKLMAREGDVVVIQGDHTEENGITLTDVDGVTVRGFTVRDFGTLTAGSPDEDGIGSGIELLHANANTIEKNEIFGNDMAGILVLESSGNIIQDNVIHDNDPNGTGRGLHIRALSEATRQRAARNIVRRNRISRHPLAGIMIRDAGLGNEVLENNLNDNGRYGLANIATDGTHIEANRASDERGLWSFPTAPQMSYGIFLSESGDVDTREIIAFGNSHTPVSFDLFWDGKGTNRFVRNGCGRSSVDDLCSIDGGLFPERGPKQY